MGLDSVATYEDIYNWLIQFYAPLLYPEVNPPPQGSPTDTPVVYLGMPDRLYVSGNARILAAHRIRQVRSNKVDCDVMDFMSTVDGYEIECLGEYSEEASVQDIYDEDSSQYAALGDFRLPFTYRDIKDLDTRSIELEGIYASYHQVRRGCVGRRWGGVSGALVQESGTSLECNPRCDRSRAI